MWTGGPGPPRAPCSLASDPLTPLGVAPLCLSDAAWVQILLCPPFRAGRPWAARWASLSCALVSETGFLPVSCFISLRSSHHHAPDVNCMLAEGRAAGLSSAPVLPPSRGAQDAGLAASASSSPSLGPHILRGSSFLLPKHLPDLPRSSLTGLPGATLTSQRRGVGGVPGLSPLRAHPATRCPQ